MDSLINCCNVCGQVFETEFIYRDTCDRRIKRAERSEYAPTCRVGRIKRRRKHQSPPPLRKNSLMKDFTCAQRKGLSYGQYMQLKEGKRNGL